MVGWRFAVAVMTVASLVGCSPDPAPPQFRVGATPVGAGQVALRITSCRAGALQEVAVGVDGKGPDDGPVLWRVVADGEGPELAEGGTVDVVLGEVPDGLVEREPLARPLPEHELVRVDIDLESQSFGFFFRREDLEADRYVITGGDHVDAEGVVDLGDQCD